MKWIILLAILISGCDITPPTRNTPKFKEFKLEDGTRCIEYSYYNKYGISCDWRHE